MKLISEINDLKKLDDFLSALSDKLVIKIGSWSRIAHQYLANWGVQVTEKNRDWIKKHAARSFLEEWRASTEKSNEAIEKAIAEAKLEIGNERLNAQLGEMVASILKNMHDGKRTFTIYDLGAGPGDTTIAVLDALDLYEDTQRIAPYCNFRLVEPGSTRLKIAEAEIAKHSLYKSLANPPVYVCGSYDYFESDIRRGAVDVFISNAVLHHFPFPDHFHQIYEKLAEDGVMVTGDWHNTIFTHPAFMAPLLEAVGGDTNVVNEFKNRFCIKDGDRERLEAQLTPRQKECHRAFIDFQRALSIRLRDVKEMLCMVECLETIEDRVKNMEDAGFETRSNVLRQEHPGFRETTENKKLVFPDNDLAGVVAVGKLKQRKNEPPQRSRNQTKKEIRPRITY